MITLSLLPDCPGLQKRVDDQLRRALEIERTTPFSREQALSMVQASDRLQRLKEEFGVVPLVTKPVVKPVWNPPISKKQKKV